ncbi:MAG TPA: ATP-dependent Clp protease proteolytic subunit [Azonexus sp.]|nr:ATP-dependent Clp protease proteolytic subunit [Azonexus sp.]
MGTVRKIATLGKRAPDGAWDIPLVGDVGAPGFSSEDLLRELLWAKPKAVRFIINSPGGLVYDAIAVAGWIREQGIEVYAEIYGLCMSAATVFAALAGPKRTAMAPGSMFLVHKPYGGDEKAVDNAVSFLVDLYSAAYGWSKAEAKKHIEAEDGEGVLWTATEAKKIGVVGEIMSVAAVAAKMNPNPEVMNQPKKIKVTASVKLGTMDAIRAAVGDGATVEVELDADEATQNAIAEKEATISQLTKEVEDLKATGMDNDAKDAEVTAAKDEATKAKADLDTATQAHTKALEDLKTAHAAEIAALKKPLAKATVPDNQEANTQPATIDHAVASVKSQFTKGMSPIQKAQYERALKAKAEKEAK